MGEGAIIVHSKAAREDREGDPLRYKFTTSPQQAAISPCAAEVCCHSSSIGGVRSFPLDQTGSAVLNVIRMPAHRHTLNMLVDRARSFHPQHRVLLSTTSALRWSLHLITV